MRIAAKVCGLVLAAAVAAPGLAQAELIIGLTRGNDVVSFDSATPGVTASTRAITGLGGGDVLVGLDLRPMDGQLYSLATSGNLYRFSDAGSTYRAILVGNVGVSGLGLAANYGFDFNPVPDRLRLVDSRLHNLRINPDDAVTIVDGSINPADLNLAGAAYANSFAGATSTTLFAIDTVTGSLQRSTNPNAGSYVSVGSLGLGPLAADDRIGFDISGATGLGYFNRNGSLYTVDLTSGSATLLGGIGSGSLVGLTVGPTAAVPEPATWAMMLLGFGVLGGVVRRRRTTVAA